MYLELSIELFSFSWVIGTQLSVSDCLSSQITVKCWYLVTLMFNDIDFFVKVSIKFQIKNNKYPNVTNSI